MKKRFVPSYYNREQHQKLHKLTQGSNSVEDFPKEMEMLLIKANIEEDRVVTVAKFIGGLNKEIADVDELHHYIEMEGLVNISKKVERHQKQKGAAKAFPNPSSKWSSKWNKHDEKKEMKG
jgi:hypothetical protein